MSYCGNCNKIYHPDWCIESDKGGIVCLFCHLKKDTLTIEDDNGKVLQTVTKGQAYKNYVRYLKELSEKENIAKILVKDR